MKELSKKALPYLIGAIFFFVPLFFSHILKVLGFPVVFGNSSYERAKVELFYSLLVIIAPLWMLSPFFSKTRTLFRDKRTIVGGVVFFVILLISASIAPDMSNALWGGMEKRQGIIFFGMIWLFGIMLKTLPETCHDFFIKISFASLACVLFYASMQWMGLDQLGSRYALSFSGDRAFSTLGNPNYLAGYLILFLPLVQKITKTSAVRNFWYGIILFGVIISGSLLGICVTIGYCAFRLFSFYKKKGPYIILMATLCVLGASVASSPILPTEKLGSAEHRMIIWKTSLRMVSASPERLLFGYGPEQFQTLFPFFIEQQYTRYFGDNTPDRAHNVFLDVFFSFGAIGLGFFLVLLVLFFKNRPISTLSSQVLLLFLVFFSFNIPVLVHFLILALAVSLKD